MLTSVRPVTLGRVEGLGRDRRSWALALMGGAVWFAVSACRWQNLRAGASDLGIFDQAVWLLSRGRAPFSTTIGINVFADHVSPVLLGFVPLYRLVATPLWLLAAQAGCLGVTVVPARRLAAELGVGRGWATFLVFTSPFLWAAAMYDVHPVVFATPAVAWLLLAVHRNDSRSATIATVLIALCRADTVIVVAGAAILTKGRLRRRLLLLLPVPLVVAQVVPHLLGTWQTFDRYYGRLGTTPVDAMTHPWRIFLLVPSAVFLLLSWLVPAGFLPLRRPRWCIALVIAGLPLLLSSWRGIAEPWWHHGAVMVPFVVGGTLAALVSRRPDVDVPPQPSARFDRLRVGVATVLALATISPFSAWAPTQVRFVDVIRPAPPAVARAISEVGPHEVVSTSNDVAARLAHRRGVYNFPCPFPSSGRHRACSHSNLVDRAGQVDVVVLVGNRDLWWLPGRWRIRHVDGITIARRSR